MCTTVRARNRRGFDFQSVDYIALSSFQSVDYIALSSFQSVDYIALSSFQSVDYIALSSFQSVDYIALSSFQSVDYIALSSFQSVDYIALSSFQSVDYIALSSFLSNVNWVELFRTVASSDVNGLWALFKQYIYNAIERFVPLRKNHPVYRPRTIFNYPKYILRAQKRKLIMWRNRHAPGGQALYYA